MCSHGSVFPLTIHCVSTVPFPISLPKLGASIFHSSRSNPGMAHDTLAMQVPGQGSPKTICPLFFLICTNQSRHFGHADVPGLQGQRVSSFHTKKNCSAHHQAEPHNISLPLNPAEEEVVYKNNITLITATSGQTEAEQLSQGLNTVFCRTSLKYSNAHQSQWVMHLGAF